VTVIISTGECGNLTNDLNYQEQMDMFPVRYWDNWLSIWKNMQFSSLPIPPDQFFMD
jgi:hypothetical protein